MAHGSQHVLYQGFFRGFRAQFVCLAAVLLMASSSNSQNNASGSGNENGQPGFKYFQHAGEKVRVKKDTRNNNTYIITESGDDLNAEDLVAMEKREREYNLKMQGCIIPSLREVLDRKVDNDWLDVLVVFKHDELRRYDKTKHTDVFLAEQSRSHQTKVKNRGAVERILRRYELLRTETGQPLKELNSGEVFVRCMAKRSTLEKMAFEDAIASIEEYFEPEPCIDYGSLINSAYNPNMTTKGRYDLSCATFESGLRDSFLQCLGIWPRPAYLATPNTTYESLLNHSEATFNILRMTSPNSTHKHFAGSYMYNEQWIIDNEIKTVSKSTTSPVDPLWYNHRVMDHFSYQYPQPIFCNPTGNSGFDLVSCWGSYNGLSVGNVEHWYEKIYFIFGCTQTTNPDDRYGAWLNDREMPYIVTPGRSPDPAAPVTTDCSYSVWCGTSFSAPITNGVCANLISGNRYSLLKDWPEATRAIILATARNVEYGEWNQFEDQKDGAGVISGHDAEVFANNATFTAWDNSYPCPHGVCRNSWYHGDTDERHFNISIPNPMPEGKHLRVVLTWDSNASTAQSGGVNELSDFDLYMEGNSREYISDSVNSNIEIINVPQDDLTPGDYYYCSVQHSIDRIPAGEFTYFCVAWTWAEDSANSLYPWWDFREGDGDITRPFLGGSDGTIIGAEWAPGFIGSALEFNGGSDRVEIQNKHYFNNLDAFAMAAWVYPTSYSTYNSILSKVNPTREFVFWLLSDGRLNAHFTQGSSYYHCTSTETVPLNKWTHVGAVWTGTAWQLYINGDLVKETSHAGHAPVWGGSRMGIGTMNWSYGFNGKIDEVQFFGSLMTPDQMGAIYAGEIVNTWSGNHPLMGMWSLNGTTADQSEFSNAGTLYNGASYTQGQDGFGNAVLLDGADDQIRISNPAHFNGMNDFYISAWIYPTSYKNYDTIISKTTPNRDFDLQMLADGRLNVHFAHGSTYYGLTSDDVIPLNQWSYVGASYSTDARWRLYYNGRLIKTSDRFLTDTNMVIQPLWTGERMGIGTLSWSYTFAGKIDEVKIYGDRLRDEQILDEYMAHAVGVPAADFYIDQLPFEHNGSTAYKTDDWDTNGGMPDGSDQSYKLILREPALIDINLCDGYFTFSAYVEIFDKDGVSTGNGHFFDPNYCSPFEDISLDAGVYYIVVDSYYHQYGNYPLHVDYSR